LGREKYWLFSPAPVVLLECLFITGQVIGKMSDQYFPEFEFYLARFYYPVRFGQP